MHSVELEKIENLRKHLAHDPLSLNTLLILEDYLKYAPTQEAQLRQVCNIINRWFTAPSIKLTVGCLFTQGLASRYEQAVAQHKEIAKGKFFVYRAEPTTLDLLEILLGIALIKQGPQRK